MRASREVRRWVSWLRKRYGRKNGVVPAGLFDNPEMERKAAASNKRRNHHAE